MYTLDQLNRWDAEARAAEETVNLADAQYTIGQPNITVAAYLKRPDLLMHRMLDIAQKGFIVDALLQGGYNIEGGVIPYTRSESLYLDRDPEEIPEGGFYPVTGDTLPPQLEERARKYGLKTFITEEAVRRSQFPMIERELRKLTNTIVKYVDGLFMSKIMNDPGIQTRAAQAAWTPANATLGQDIENARADVRNLYEGYEIDTLVLHPAKVPALTMNNHINQYFQGTMAPRNPYFTGQLAPLFGLDILYTPNLPSQNTALLLQRKMLGGIADEVPLQVKALPFNEDNDSYWLKGRRVTATFLTDPKCVVKLTGI